MSTMPSGPARSRSIVHRVMLLVLSGFVTSMGLLGTVTLRHLRALEHELHAQRLASARGIAAHVDHHLIDVFETLQEVASSLAPRGLDDRRLVAELLRSRYVESRKVDGLAVWDRTAALVATAPAAASPPCDATCVQTLIEARRPTATNIITGEGGRRVVLLSVPLSRWDGSLAGLVTGELEVGGRRFTGILMPLAPPEFGRVTIVDGQGALAFSNGVDLPPGGRADAEFRLAAAPWRVLVSGPMAASRTRLAWFWGGVVPGLLAFSLLLAWGVARSVLKPIRALSLAAERIAAGDLSQPVPPMPADEVGRLGQAFERMRVALGESLARIAAANAQLEQRVAERTAELAEANRQLVEREQARVQLLRKVIRAQEDERKRVARELHDGPCQTLTALTLRLEAACAAAMATPAGPAVADARQLARASLEEVHRLMHDLRPSVLDDLGLCAALRWFAERHLTAQGVHVRFEIAVLPERLAPELETALFRAAQEAMTNIERHARAERVLVQCGVEGDDLVLEIEDDGEGFDPAAMTPRPGEARGLGLLGMRERVELFGGRVDIDSAPGRGTRVAIRVPVPPAGAAGHEQDPRAAG